LDAPIEELGLTETDILIVEIREEGKGWNFIQEGVDNLDKCDNCYKYGKNKFYCKCKKVAYCSEECKIKDQRYHMNHCDVADQSDEDTETWSPSEESRMGITGLSNLGNTCFMNSALQCMSNTYELTQYFLTGSFRAEINMENPLGSQGKIAKRFASFLKALWYESSKVFSPYGIKAAIAKLNPIVILENL
jgi:ubiquitin carboxyl-terminal hydrolase 4/11